jgi:IclR family pca regulon transcriptional regulator
MSVEDPWPFTASHFDRDVFIQSVGRGLAVIRAFGPGRSQLTISEVAKAAQLDRAGARRILFTLQSLGYVGVEGRLFHLTSRVRDLARGYLSQSLWKIARPQLEHLAATLNETVSAGVLDGFDLVYTLRMQRPRIFEFDLGAGAHIPAHTSSMGQVLLAALSPVELSIYMRQARFVPLTGTTLISKEALTERLQLVRKQGWGIARGEFEPGTTGVSVPLVDREGSTLAALNVSMTTERTSPEYVEGRILPILTETAAAITAALSSEPG